MQKETLINITGTYFDVEGDPIEKYSPEAVKKDPAKKGILTCMADVLRMAATAELPEDSQGGSQNALEKKMKGFDINVKISEAVRGNKKEVVLTKDEIDYIKPRIAMCWSTLVAIPAVMHLDEGVKPLVTEHSANTG